MTSKTYESHSYLDIDSLSGKDLRKMRQKIAFLGYDENQTSLIKYLEKLGFDVTSYQCPISDLSNFDLVVSFGYRHILEKDVLDTAKRAIVNLHISYLPYNRGAHPNFWSWVEDTPSGVTLHEIDTGIDTGDIITQKRLYIDPTGLTFKDTYGKLTSEIEALFMDHFSRIIGGDYQAERQSFVGTHHRVADLPKWMSSWDMQITEAIERYKNGF